MVDSNIYAATSHSGASGAPKRPICMHVLLTGYDLTDHRNGDGLDNRRENLRIATQAQNLMNRGCPSNNTSGFKGVTRKRDKWAAECRAGGAKKRIAGFATAEQAARAYDAMAIEMHGEFAWLNFPDDPAHEMPPLPAQYCTRPDCGQEYTARRSNSRYCSQRCAEVMHYRRKLEAAA